MEWYTGKILDPPRKGVAISIQGQLFEIPEYSSEVYERLIPYFADLQKSQEIKDESGQVIQSADMVTALRTRRHIAAVTLAQNYPDMTPELVGRYLKLEDVGTVIEAANEAGRLARGESPGEAPAGAVKPAPALN